jgi:biopolymer transport protein ExbD
MSAPIELAWGYVLGLCGIAVLLWPTLIHCVEEIAPDTSMTFGRSLADQSIEWRRQRRLPLKTRFTTLPNRGLVGGSAVLLLLLPAYLIVEGAVLEAKGIYVRLAATPSHTPNEYCLAGPIVVTLRRSNEETRTFVSGAELRREELPRALTKELAARANWEVFVEVDDSLEFAYPMDVIDVITTLHAKPVILTPKLKEQLVKQCRAR